MSRPIKRLKVSEDVVVQESNPNPTSKTMKEDNYLTSDTFNHTVMEESKLLFAKLRKRIESIESSAVNKIVQKQEFMAEASLAILDLKRLQRRILNRVTKSEKVLQQQVVVAQKQQLKLDNLMYQHLLNLASIERCTASVKNTESSDLYKLALATKGNTEHVGISDAGSVVNDYLLGTDWKDPQQRHVILSILNREISSRQTLEQQLAQCEKELTSKKEVLAAKRKLLNELPNKLAEMEKASLPLQKFSHKSLDLTPKLSSQRRQRLDLARTLPKPLYVLFHQLQSCLDLLLHRNENDSDGKVLVGGKESLPKLGLVSEETSEDPAVQLKIPIPTISEGGNISFTPEKTATLSFHYCASIDVVTAYCINESGVNDDTVIGELFPGDIGEWMPRIDTAVVASSGNSGKDTGLPYQWCNYLAGLHIAPAEQMSEKLHDSAQVIILALIRRVRATATLSWLVHALSCKPQAFPMHRAMVANSQEREDDDDCFDGTSGNITLNLFEPDTTSHGLLTKHQDSNRKHNHLRSYLVSFKDTASGSVLNVRVEINVARYPSVPPLWKVAAHSPFDTARMQEIPLFNEELDRIEKTVNRNIDQMVDPADQTTYEWILAQQVLELSRLWEKSLNRKC